jgi:hypothetical protein
MSVISATPEAEIEKIGFKGRLAKVSKTLSQQTSQAFQGTVSIPAIGEELIGGPQSKVGSRQKCGIILKNKLRQKRAGSVVEVVEDLPSNCKFLSSNPSTPLAKYLVQSPGFA